MNASHHDMSVSAFVFDVLREVLRKTIVENHVPESQWSDRAVILVRTFTGEGAVDQRMIDALVHGCRDLREKQQLT